MDKTFSVALVLYLILLVAWPDSGFEALAAFATYVLGAWIALRLLRIGLRKLTWRLRNRLIVAYLFIAVLPILLVLTLVALGGYMLAGSGGRVSGAIGIGPAAGFASLRCRGSERLSGSHPTHCTETEQQRFPGLILWTAQNGANQKWPPDADVSLARRACR